jgi:hypothetical protein
MMTGLLKWQKTYGMKDADSRKISLRADKNYRKTVVWQT